ncbi:hypothetical protein ACFWN7_13025 [Agromyces sp. NPDC058484]|uniref:hypothetical protein n=1 Tax=Agromyces sp. NPDC058484 TaxID=3346524 RepID=UPI003646CE94
MSHDLVTRSSVAPLGAEHSASSASTADSDFSERVWSVDDVPRLRDLFEALGVFRRKRRRYLDTLAAAQQWERLFNSASRGGRQLQWIIQSAPIMNGQKTNALTQSADGTTRSDLWIWGWFPSGLWIDYLTASQSVAGFAPDSAQRAWHALDRRARNAPSTRPRA